MWEFIFLSFLIFYLSIFLAKRFVYRRKKCVSWDSDYFPIKFVKGISFIFDSNSNKSLNNFIILFSHGNEGTILDREYIQKWVRNLGMDLCFYDYTGYGASKSNWIIQMNQNILRQDIFKIYCWLIENYPNKKIILFGESLGCYPSCWLAKQSAENFKNIDQFIISEHNKIINNIDRLILCLPFDKLSSVIGKLTWLSGELDNLEWTQKLNIPTCIIYAKHDRKIPPVLSQILLFTIVGYVRRYGVNTGHNNYFNEETKEKLKKFIFKDFSS